MIFLDHFKVNLFLKLYFIIPTALLINHTLAFWEYCQSNHIWTHDHKLGKYLRQKYILLKEEIDFIEPQLL